jgi:hypothetical protein
MMARWKGILLAVPLSVLVATLSVTAAAQAQTVGTSARVHVSAHSLAAAPSGLASRTAWSGQAEALAARIHGGEARPRDDWWECYPWNYAGHGCDNTDPVATGCSQDSKPITGGDSYGDGYRAEIYYSYSCQTVWAVLWGLDSACYDCALKIAVLDSNCGSLNGGSVGYPQYGVIYNGAWTNQFYLPPNEGDTAVASVWNPWDGGDIAVSPSWPAPPYCGW